MEKILEEPRKERFEFVFSVNGNIICQRYFRINGFQEKSLGSVQLTKAVEECYRVINRDLTDKSVIYTTLTAPQVFKDRAEMNSWVEKQPFKLEVPSFVTLRDEDVVFIWTGNEMRPYEKPFNRSDYAGERNDTPCVLKFAFLDNGEEVRSISWDGNVYPRFVRTNIDISNSRNKYESEEFYAPYEAFIVNEFNKRCGDIIPYIMRTLTNVCSNESLRYYSRVKYGNKEYDLNLKGYNERLFLSMKKRAASAE